MINYSLATCHKSILLVSVVVLSYRLRVETLLLYRYNDYFIIIILSFWVTCVLILYSHKLFSNLLKSIPDISLII